jgi:ABC-type glycerol-3-phosphate transport system substrate-binding protein
MAGYDRVVATTDLVPFPRRADREPVARNRPGFDGILAFGGADDREAVNEVVEYLYGDTERAASHFAPEPGRFLPAWQSVFDSEAYRTLDRFQAYPHLLELVETVRNEVIPLAATSEQYVVTPTTVYAERSDEFYQIAQEIIVEGREPGPVAKDARVRLSERLTEGQQIAAE